MVRVEREGAVLVVTIDRPGARNAVNLAVANGIAAAMDTLDDDPTLSVGVLAGEGEVFCAGMDLKAFLAGEGRPRVDGRGFAGLVERPSLKPLVAAVEGPALAGGLEVALSCDLLVASRTATFGLPEVKRGLVAAGGGLHRLPAVLPRHLAAELALTGDTCSAEHLARHGMVNRVVEPGTARAEAIALAQRIGANAPLALRATKKILTEAIDWPRSDAFERTRAITGPVMDSADAREGAAAFAEQRTPQWTGQ